MEDNLRNFDNPQIYEKIGCVLQASGSNFEPDSFLSESSLPYERVLFKGALDLPAEVGEKINIEELPYPEALEVFGLSNLLINISEATNLLTQIDEATLFLKNHLPDLKRLRTYPNIESITIRFLTEQEEALSDFPPDFTNLISEIGIDGIML